MSDMVRIHEENGSITLTPVGSTTVSPAAVTPVVEKKHNFDVLFGMFSDGRISTEEYMREKQREKELED